MYDSQLVTAAFSGLIGWRQNNDPNGIQLDEDLTASLTGLYYDDAHPTLNFDNVKEVAAPNFRTYADEEAAHNKWLREQTNAAIIAVLDAYVAGSGLLRDSFACDYTDAFTTQQEAFRRPVQIGVAAYFLRIIAFNGSVRNNRNEEAIGRPAMLFELDGDSQGRDAFSVNAKLREAISAVSLDVSGIPAACLLSRKYSVAYKSIGPKHYPYPTL